MKKPFTLESNRIRDLLAQGDVPVGIQAFAGSPALIEIAGFTGFDFVMIDTEHSSIDGPMLEHLVRSAESSGIEPLVRVATLDDVLIRRALEVGARGVIVPQVRSRADVDRAIEAATFPPYGRRGTCPAIRSAQYSIERWEEYVTAANENVMVIPLIEHPDAVVAINEICGADEVDMVLFGPADLGMMLGAGAQGLADPAVAAAFERVLEAASANGTSVMAVPFPDLSAASCRTLISRGVRILLHSVDELLFENACRDILTELKGNLRAEPVGDGA